MLPFSLSGTVIVDDGPKGEDVVKRALGCIKAELAKHKAKDIRLADHVVTFRSGVFRLVRSTNPLAGVTKGRVSVLRSGDSVTLEYRVWFTQVFVGSIVLAILGALHFSAARGTLSVKSVVGEAAAAFAFLFIGGVLFAIVQFRSLLERAIEQCVTDDHTGGYST